METENTSFEYIYRDGSNFKQHWQVTFSGSPEPVLTDRLNAALYGGELFIAGQVDVPERFFPDLGEEDHCWHELWRVEPTSTAPDDAQGRTFLQFVEAVERASGYGWQAFNPFERAAEQQERMRHAEGRP